MQSSIQVADMNEGCFVYASLTNHNSKTQCCEKKCFPINFCPIKNSSRINMNLQLYKQRFLWDHKLALCVHLCLFCLAVTSQKYIVCLELKGSKKLKNQIFFPFFTNLNHELPLICNKM